MNHKKCIEKYADLFQTVMEDPVIKRRIIDVLQLSSFERRTVLINWLEQLRLRHASGKLLKALSCLFDDEVAEGILNLIDNHKI